MKALSSIRSLCEARIYAEFESLRQEKASGTRIAGFTCHHFPEAVLAGINIRPVRVLCGASADAQSRGGQIVRADVCPHVKSLLGNILKKSGIHADIDIWIGLATCDQMRRGMAALADTLNKEAYFLHLPATRTAEAAEYYVHEVQRIVSDISAKYNLSFAPHKAEQWQKERDKAAKVLSRAARIGAISPLDLHYLFHIMFIARPDGLAEFFEDAVKASEKFTAKKTVVLAGSPLAFEDAALLEYLETKGIGIMPLSCTGLNTIDNEYTAGGQDVLRSLTLGAFRKPACARARSNREVYERIHETIKATGAAGLIIKCLKFCDHWYTERERMRSSFSVPVMVFDSDYADGGKERLFSRIDAFIETLG